MAIEFTTYDEAAEEAGNLALLSEVYFLAESDSVRGAAARIMDYVDTMLREGRLDTCGRLLGAVDISRLSKYPTLLIAFLTITLGAKDKLGESRREFYSRTLAALGQELSQERAERLLHRFE
jgi:hypothetical protein